jgi:hypothetical protein
MELTLFNSPVQLEILFPTIAARPGLSECGSWYRPLSVVAPCDRGLELERPAGPLGGSGFESRRPAWCRGWPRAQAGTARAHSGRRAHWQAPDGPKSQGLATPSSSHSASGPKLASPPGGRRRGVFPPAAAGRAQDRRGHPAIHAPAHGPLPAAHALMRAGDPAGRAGGRAAARQGRCPSPRAGATRGS